MPLQGFICPDGVKCSVKACLADGGCRMQARCGSRPFLRLAADCRPWTGVPSTTQCIKGTMEAFLEITKGYYVKPADQTKRIHGVVGHKTLETSTDELSTLEMAMKGFYCSKCGASYDMAQPPKFCGECGNNDIRRVDVTGILDVLECENGVNTLIDNKFTGSYRMARALGLCGKRRATGDCYKTGARSGMPKTRVEIVKDSCKRDLTEWTLQLNHYRLLLKQRGIEVTRLMTQCFVRDAGDWVATQRGITEPMYMVEIPIIPDETVERYFAVKAAYLIEAVASGKWTQPCKMSECWDGMKCKRFCNVAEWCPQGQHFKQHRDPLTVEAPIAVKEGAKWPWMKRLLPI